MKIPVKDVVFLVVMSPVIVVVVVAQMILSRLGFL